MKTIDAYLEQLASETPTPGGGSAATIVAASGAALVAMVARISLNSPKYAAHRELAESIVRRADALREELLAARVVDESAFERVVTAQGLPRTSDAEKHIRSQQLEAALHDAAEAPLRAAQLAFDVERLATLLLEIPNRNLISDVGCAAEFAAAAVSACAYNVRINHRFMKDTSAIARQTERIERYERETTGLLHGMRSAIARM